MNLNHRSLNFRCLSTWLPNRDDSGKNINSFLNLNIIPIMCQSFDYKNLKTTRPNSCLRLIGIFCFVGLMHIFQIWRLKFLGWCYIIRTYSKMECCPILCNKNKTLFNKLQFPYTKASYSTLTLLNVKKGTLYKYIIHCNNPAHVIGKPYVLSSLWKRITLVLLFMYIIIVITKNTNVSVCRLSLTWMFVILSRQLTCSLHSIFGN